MKKWLKYSILISILMPLLMSDLSAQEYNLQKFVFGNGGMVAQQAIPEPSPTGPILYGMVGQSAIEKREARSILHGNSYDLYQGFWTPSNIVISSVENNFNEEEKLVNYPNPFSSSTTIEYELEASAFVTLKIYDMVGNEIAKLTESYQAAGSHAVVWDAKNQFGDDVSSGSYIYQLSVQPASTAGSSPFTPYKLRKVMVIVK